MYEKLVAGLEPATFCLPQKSPDFRGPRRENQQVFRLSANLYYKEKRARLTGSFLFGATGRTRTGDLLITNQLLYQLSHSSAYRYNILNNIMRLCQALRANLIKVV